MTQPIASLVLLAALAGMPGLAGAQAQRPAKAGDVHVYSTELRTDRTRFEETVTIQAIESGQMRTVHVRSDRSSPAEGLYGTDWSTIRSGTTGTRMDAPAKVLQHPLQVGATWENSYDFSTANGARTRYKAEATVAARETVRTPAGEFEAFRIESKGYLSGLSWQGGWGVVQKLWYAPAIDRIVRSEFKEQRTMGADNVTELKAFKPAN